MNISTGTHMGLTFLLLGVGGVYRPVGGGAADFFGVTRPPRFALFAIGAG